jgi:hypothetical protein
MWRSRWRCVIKPAYSVSFLLSINIFVWQNVLYFPNDLRTKQKLICILISSVFPSLPPCLCVCLTSLTSQHCTSIQAHCTWQAPYTHTHTHTHTHTPLKTEEPKVAQTMDPWNQTENIANTPHEWWQETLSKFSYSKSQLPHYTNSLPLHCNSTAVVLVSFYSINTGSSRVQHIPSTNTNIFWLPVYHMWTELLINQTSQM